MLTPIAIDTLSQRAWLLLTALLVVFAVEVCSCVGIATGHSSPPLVYTYDRLFLNLPPQVYPHWLVAGYRQRVDLSIRAIEQWAPGRTDSEIAAALGTPANVEGPIQLDSDWTATGSVPLCGVWNEARTADSNWIFEMGATGEDFVLVTLNNHRCASVHRFDYGEHLYYQHWKADQILKFAWAGTEHPLPWRAVPPEPIPEQRTKSTEAIRERFGQPTCITPGGEMWYYETGGSTAVALSIFNDKCVYAEPLAIFH